MLHEVLFALLGHSGGIFVDDGEDIKVNYVYAFHVLQHCILLVDFKWKISDCRSCRNENLVPVFSSIFSRSVTVTQ